MLLPRLGALLLAASTAQAFKNSSPFLLLSSEPLPNDAPLQSAQLALTKDVEDRLIDSLSACDKRLYYIYSQDHVSADDFREGALPAVHERLAGVSKGAMVQIPEVVVMGELSAGSVRRRLEAVCSKKGKKSVSSSTDAKDEYRIMEGSTAALPSNLNDKTKGLSLMDKDLNTAIDFTLNYPQSAIFIYITTPHSTQQEQEANHLYEMDDPYPSAPLHTDLKRDLHEINKRQSDNDTDFQGNLGLFEKYQFFTPGLFMGLTVSVFLLAILYVGISAISGLEVSYYAFSKEMGQQGQRGKQQ